MTDAEEHIPLSVVAVLFFLTMYFGIYCIVNSAF